MTVFVLKHADWRNEAIGTINSLRARSVTLHDGSPDLLYWIEFDEPQRDYTDEMNGMDLEYKSSQVLGRFLRPLDEAG